MENKIILTNMCMVYDNNGNILVQDRVSKDWPGINFPGGHVEYNESLEESCIREMKEETGLELKNLEFVGVYEWNIIKDHIRHLAILYKTKDYSGELISSNEGKMLWIKPENVNKYKQSTDFDKILELMLK
ncbi:MAG: NUDIX domain-containing protein [Bacilli bacterium]|jgi:8-oxo-dGTP diphosphatase